MPPKLNLREFNMKTMLPKGAKIVCIGKSGSGKSTVIEDIMWHRQDIPLGMVISGTEIANGFYSRFVPGKLIHDKYTPDLIKNFVTRQIKAKDHERRTGATADNRAFLIMDDCVFDDSWTRDDMIRFLYMNGRHVDCDPFIVSMQYPLGIPPALRTNVDLTFILREPIRKNRIKIWENYAGMFPTFQLFEQVMDLTTENFECLVINNRTTSNRLQDQIFFYKAEMHAPFQCCSRQLWVDNKPFKSTLVDLGEDEDFDPASVRSKRMGPTVYVKKTKY